MKQIQIRQAVLAAALACGVVATAVAEPYVESFDNGSVNWQTGEITATGIGVPPDRYGNSTRGRIMAKRAAVVMAQRALLERVQGVRLESQTLVKDMAVESDIVRTQLKGTLRNASMVGKPVYNPDGSVEVTMGINMRRVAKTVLASRPSAAAAAATAAPAKPAAAAPTSSSSAVAVVTGLVIDARGKGLETAMFPHVYDEDGHEVYGASMVMPEKKDNIVAYDTSPDDAAKLERLGKHAIVIKALRVQDRSDIVISNADAKKLGEMAGMQDTLRQARVAFAL